MDKIRTQLGWALGRGVDVQVRPAPRGALSLQVFVCMYWPGMWPANGGGQHLLLLCG